MSRSDAIRVMIVDDHSMVRRGLATILRVKPDLHLVGEATNGLEAVQLCEQTEPDVILMDLVMPEMDGAAATRAIRARWPDIQVLALTSYKEKELVQAALEAGAIGYLLKHVSADELVDAIRGAYAGRPTLAPEVAQVLVQAEKMEQLAHAILDAPYDGSTLPKLLKEYVPSMFKDSQIEIRLFPDVALLRHPAGTASVPEAAWTWMRSVARSSYFLPGAELPWGGWLPLDEGIAIAPIVPTEILEPIGGIYLSQRRDPGAVADLLPVVKSLAAQVGSALHTAQIYTQTLAHEKLARELAMAGQIQASFLPGDLPKLPGWQVSARLEPARETSGDFYDLITLSNGRLGVVVADVSDKGMGAALYMALSRTLIRTYAGEYASRPDLVLDATNRRILSDARAGLFVTVFYGVLDPASGMLTYCNAGHNPPYLLSGQDPTVIRSLEKTGMALGATEETTWQHNTVQIAPGDTLVLYTDGITEAQNLQGELFGPTRLAELLQTMACSPSPPGPPASQIERVLLNSVHQYMGDAPQSDDMTLVILQRALDTSTED